MNNNNIKPIYSWVLLIFVFIGLISSMYLVFERHKIEKAQNSIENIVDYDTLLRSIPFEKTSEEEVWKKVKDSGVTAMAIYDLTLEKLLDSGDIQIVRTENMDNWVFYGEPKREGITYIMPVEGKYPIFQETWEALRQRLGADRIKLYHTSAGFALGLEHDYTPLVKMNLGISRIQAESIVNRGFNVIVRPTNFVNVTKEDVDFTLNRLEGIPNITGVVFVGKEVLGYENILLYTLQRLNQMRIPVVGIESTTQLQYETQSGFLEMAKTNKYSVGRLYTISKDEMKKVKPDEAAQRFYISDVERNIRFNLFPIYENGVDNKTALQTSLDYIKVSTEKLANKGYIFGRASVYPPYSPRLGAMLGALSGATALIVFVFSMFFSLSIHRQLILFFTLLFVVLLGYLLTGGVLVRQIMALASAILAPVGAMIFLLDRWKHSEYRVVKVTPLKQVLLPLWYLISTALIAAIGGLYIAGILGSTEFFMEFSLFRGVKLSFIMPLVLVAIAYIQRFPVWKGREIHNIQEGKTFIKEFFNMEIKMYTLLFLAVMAGAVWIFVGRSGHTAGVPVPAFELALRRFLENNLYARPREKEFLIGHPALMIASFVFLRKWPMIIHFFITVAGTIGVASMVETFAHIRTPVYMSIMRGLDGLLIGIFAGLVGILVFRFMEYCTSWYKKQGA